MKPLKHYWIETGVWMITLAIVMCGSYMFIHHWCYHVWGWAING